MRTKETTLTKSSRVEATIRRGWDWLHYCFFYFYFFTIKSWTTETMFYFLNKIACCFTLQSSCLGELIKLLKIEPSSVQVPIKLCGIKLCLVSSKQFISVTKVRCRHKFQPKLNLDIFLSRYPNSWHKVHSCCVTTGNVFLNW